MGPAERVHDLVAPLLAPLGLELFDVELIGPVLRIAVERQGGHGVDLDTISEATTLISHALDDDDPIPGRYTLEVSSPGLERPLRTPAHFRRFIGETVSVKTRTEVDGERRIAGVLGAADDFEAGGITVAGHTIPYDEIAKARTVFEWGPTPKPAGAPPRTKKQSKKKAVTR